MREYHRKSCGISRDVYYQVKGILMGAGRENLQTFGMGEK